jgi:hypothetical protein
MKLLDAQLDSPALLLLNFTELPDQLGRNDVIITPPVGILELRHEGTQLIVRTEQFQLCREYTVLVRGAGLVQVDNSPCLRSLRPIPPMGCTMEDDRYSFRIFAPRAMRVRLLLYETPQQTVGTEYFLEKADAGVWELSLPASLRENYYAYRIEGPSGRGEMFNGQIAVGDPYARAVVTANTWRHPARCVLPDRLPEYDWEGDTHLTIDPADLVIYEMHVRDMTVHPSSGFDASVAGSYRAMSLEGRKGGLDHIRALGVNAVELHARAAVSRASNRPYQRHVAGGAVQPLESLRAESLGIHDFLFLRS